MIEVVAPKEEEEGSMGHLGKGQGPQAAYH
jgi:hypothetical protein